LSYSFIWRVESLLVAFIWKGSSISYFGAKVAWDFVSYPLKKKGLGIKRVKTWNKATIIKHV